ncbi:MAG: hypothetical protein HYY06_06545 [Deltaproteobacteria bacterium]|nr:hypothetical protein [Deltaproteobacteria bacterium]
MIDGKVAPGAHVLRVELHYQGSGGGAFPYLEGYRFRVSAQFRFTSLPGVPLRLEVMGHEQGGPTREEKPAIAFRLWSRG